MSTPKMTTEAERTTRSTVDTIHFARDEAEAWEIPDFQRNVKVNSAVTATAAQIKVDGGVFPGVITFALVGKEKRKLLIDGQQRRAAFLLSECPEGFADARFVFCATMAEASEEFVKLNSHLVVFKPDDILRGLEPSLPTLQTLRKKCPFVGYDNIGRNQRAAVVSVSAALRCWTISAPETPSSSCGSAQAIAKAMPVEDVTELCRFLTLAHDAWGRDGEFVSLWRNLNLILCMWLFRRLVLQPYSAKTVRLTDTQFRKCLVALSADSRYLEFLVGRRLSDRDRGPAYQRCKTLFAKRLHEETGTKWLLPLPSWSSR